MRVFIASIGSETYHQGQRQVFEHLAHDDSEGVHRLASDPASADAILVVDLHQHPDDPFLGALRRHDLVRRWPEKVFVYDERDQPFFTFPGVYVGARARTARRRPQVGGPYPTLPTPLEATDRSPDLLFSFQGSRTHPVRDRLLRLDHDRAVLEDTSNVDFFVWGDRGPDSQRRLAQERFADVVGRSKFVLCPRGHGPSSFRLYETLSAHRVPVVISDDWLAPPGIDWERCVVRVPEREVAGLPAKLEAVEDRWGAFVSAGHEALSQHLGPARLWHHYCTSLECVRRQKRGRVPWWAQQQVARMSARAARQALRPGRTR